MKSFIPCLTWRWRAPLCLSISMSMGIVFLSAADSALAETISLSCALDDNNVQLVWLYLDKSKVQETQGSKNSAYVQGDAVADALFRAKKFGVQTYPLTVTDGAYQWTAYNGVNVPVAIDRMTGTLRGPSFSAQCSRVAIDPPVPLPVPKF